MIIRRLVALAIAGVFTLVPTSGHSLGEPAEQIPGTDCFLGNETLIYDARQADWIASSTLRCPEVTPELALSVSVVLVEPLRRSLSFTGNGIICLSCPALQHHVSKGNPWLKSGIYQVRSQGGVYLPKDDMWGSHFSCFSVQGFEVTPLMSGCPKIE